MRLLLINPPVARYDLAELAPPLGLLYVAAKAREDGATVELLDLNLPIHRSASDQPATYADYVLGIVQSYRPTGVGLTSMGVNSHLALGLAERIKKELEIEVVVGGVHLCSIADVIVRHLSTIDIVATPILRRSRRHLWWGERVAAYSDGVDLVQALYRSVRLDDYWQGNTRRVANFEASRGCKYNCAFCYSPSAHGEVEALPISVVVRAFGELAILGFRHVFLVDDNLLNSRQWSRSLMRGLAREGSPLSWNGYATLPDLSVDDLRLASDAGCVNLYVGVDAVDAAQQKSWKKAFFRDEAALRVLLDAGEVCGVGITCAFILDVAEERDEASDLSLALAARLQASGADVRLSVLCYYPRTELAQRVACQGAQEWEYDEDRASILMDLPRVVVENGLAQLLPRAFPWHTRPRGCNWRERMFGVLAAQVLINDGYFKEADGGVWPEVLRIGRIIESMEYAHKTEVKRIVRELAGSRRRERPLASAVLERAGIRRAS
jgi:hypothetical protein